MQRNCGDEQGLITNLGQMLRRKTPTLGDYLRMYFLRIKIYTKM